MNTSGLGMRNEVWIYGEQTIMELDVGTASIGMEFENL